MPGSADRRTAEGDPPAGMIVAAGVRRSFGALAAVSDVSFRLPAGRIVGLVGSDGAGKTTLLRMIATLLSPDAGTLTVAGRDVVRERAAVKRVADALGPDAGFDFPALYREVLVAKPDLATVAAALVSR